MRAPKKTCGPRKRRGPSSTTKWVFLTKNLRDDEESEDPSDSDADILEEKPLTRTAARQKAKDLNARFAAFFELYCREPGCRGLASFFPHVEPHDEFVPDIGAPSFEFRDRELTRLGALWAFRARLSRFKARTDRGKDGKKLKKGSAMAPMRRQADGEFPAQAFEGNVDYLWAVDTGQLEAALKEKLLRKSILALFAQELTFRLAYPELQARVKRKLQGVISFDINANEAYVSSFALQSPSLVAYERGQLQATGADYAAAAKTTWQRLAHCLLGPPPLPVVFPDAAKDMSRAVAQHTTCVGVNPALVWGPRLVITLQVPPAPHDHTDQLGTDPAYDECREKYQYVRVQVAGSVNYVVRLPRGLQHRHLPELQFEVPAVEFHEAAELDVAAQHAKALKKQGLHKYTPKDAALAAAAKAAAARAEDRGDPSLKRNHLDAIAGMQRFHFNAPPQVQFGNRVDVAVGGCGKLLVQWPSLALAGCPVQIYLPVVRADRSLTAKEVTAAKKQAADKARRAEVAARVRGDDVAAPTRAERARALAQQGVFARLPTPPCHVVKPGNVLENAVVGYTRGVEQQGWAHLASPLDADGLGDPPEWSSAKVARKVHQRHGAHLAAHRAHLKASYKEAPVEEAAAALAHAVDAKARVVQRARRAAYRRFYADYTRHRVLDQVMVFAPKHTVKDFSNLRLFDNDVADLLEAGAAVVTLRPGRHLGGRIGLTVPLNRALPMDGQTANVAAPSVGTFNVRVVASNYCQLKGLHDIPVLGLGVLPWGDKPLEQREVVPLNISEVTFDFPAITQPSRKPQAAPTAKYMQQDTFLKQYTLKAPRRRQVQDIRKFNEAARGAAGGGGAAFEHDKSDRSQVGEGAAKAAAMSLLRDGRQPQTGSTGGGDRTFESNAGQDDILEEEIVLPKLGRFDVAWSPGLQKAADHVYCAAAVEKDRLASLAPSQAAEVDREAYVRGKRFRPLLRCGFPVLKAGKDAPSELLEFTKMPPPNPQLAEHGRRYQVGWVQIELPSMEPPPPPVVDLAAFAAAAAAESPTDSDRGAEGAAVASQAALAAQKDDTLRTGRAGFSIWEQTHRPSLQVYVRVPAYVTHTTRALSRLPLNDAAALGASGVAAGKAEPSGSSSGGGEGGESSGGGGDGGDDGDDGDDENAAKATVDRLKKELEDLKDDLADEEDAVHQLHAANAKLKAELGAAVPKKKILLGNVTSLFASTKPV